MKNNRSKCQYYLGLTIGYDYVSYAVTDTNYSLLKFKGEPMWGVHTFDVAESAEERRTFRNHRRIINRQQQRVHLLSEIFAEEITQIDPKFFVRLAGSRLLRSDTDEPYSLFNDNNYTDKEYHAQYPTIHHLIVDLMNNKNAHDPRLVYLACSWLVSHRGHFLYDTPIESLPELLSIDAVYQNFNDWLEGQGYTLPWSEDIAPKQIANILTSGLRTKEKIERLKRTIKNAGKERTAINFPFSIDAVIKLLCGGKAKPAELYKDDKYKSLCSFSLTEDDESFAELCAEIGDDAKLLHLLRAITDCSTLISELGDFQTVSQAKVAVYEQHQSDLAYLKYIVKKYIPEAYENIFVLAIENNYVAYSNNFKKVKSGRVHKATQEEFCEYILKKTKGIKVESKDAEQFDEMKKRLQAGTFMPKQRTLKNKLIPSQLLFYELDCILSNANMYIPMLTERDSDGITNADKIRSIFLFHIPYFVGPLNSNSKFAWIKRISEGKIYPWNFENMVDIDASERSMIARMINTCVYIPGERVLPKNSLLYSEFKVLNEINGIQINDHLLPEEAIRGILEDLFQQKVRITGEDIRDYLFGHGFLTCEDQIIGLRPTYKANCKSYISFKRLLQRGQLTIDDVEQIIERMSYVGDKKRMQRWLASNYANLSAEDVQYISKLGYKGFGSLSKYFLTSLYGVDKTTGEALTVIEAMRTKGETLNHLLSKDYDFAEKVSELTNEYYSDCPQTVDCALRDIYHSNKERRPIRRTIDVISDIEKAMGSRPVKVFVNVRFQSSMYTRKDKTGERKAQIEKLYQNVPFEIQELKDQLDDLGNHADILLQDDRLFLYFLQLGKCMYTGERISLPQLMDSGKYNIDHIYPQSVMRDESIQNNKVLVCSASNAEKRNRYPISTDIRTSMYSYWETLHQSGLINDTKFYRLTRATSFSKENRQAFVDYLLVDTSRQSKTITQMFRVLFGSDVETIYVKDRLIIDFQNEYSLVRSQTTELLHQAKNAYLNIVVGNVYDSKFSNADFSVEHEYSVKTGAIFAQPVVYRGITIWRGEPDLQHVLKTVGKNSINFTRYAYCRSGAFFHQQPVKAALGLVPLKKDLAPEKYGGYSAAAVAFYLLASYELKGKKDVMFVPIDVVDAEHVCSNSQYAIEYVTKKISEIISIYTLKVAENVKILMNGRKIKINALLSLDGMYVTVSGKTVKGTAVSVKTNLALVLDPNTERYVKQLEQYQRQKERYFITELNEIISKEKNLALYDMLLAKSTRTVFRSCPGNLSNTLINGRSTFESLAIDKQVSVLLSILSWFACKTHNCNLVDIGGSKAMGVKSISSRLSMLQKNYSDIRLIDVSPAGLFKMVSPNLLSYM